MENERAKSIIGYIQEHPGTSSSEVILGLSLDISQATIRRDLASLVADNILITRGQNRGTRYYISPGYAILSPVDVQQYFRKEVDQRVINENYNFELLDILADTQLFTKPEHEKLSLLQRQFTTNISKLTPIQYRDDMEKLAIDLSWKSSQIEGNTYSLLETEYLLKEKAMAVGKSKDEATMLLNHKEALDYIVEHQHYLQPISVLKMENIHGILIDNLGVDRNIRNRRVAITGTNYRPLDNQFQISEAMQGVCELVNSKSDVFEKALLLLVLISYIQPFNDGNKRTARILSNAELIANDYCPISFRTIDPIEYKKAMLVFYEQNNISAFKKIFIDQFEFAVNTYF